MENVDVSSTCSSRDRRNDAEQKIAPGRKTESWEGWLKSHCPWYVSCWSDVAAWARRQEADSGHGEVQFSSGGGQKQ